MTKTQIIFPFFFETGGRPIELPNQEIPQLHPFSFRFSPPRKYLAGSANVVLVLLCNEPFSLLSFSLLLRWLGYGITQFGTSFARSRLAGILSPLLPHYYVIVTLFIHFYINYTWFYEF